MSETPNDTDLWLPLDGLAPGFDAFRAPHTTALDGQTFTALMHGQDSRVTYAFANGRIESSVAGSDGKTPGSAAYEAFEVDKVYMKATALSRIRL